MTVSQILETVQNVFAAEAIPPERAAQVVEVYRVMADDVLAARATRGGNPVVLGICGSQGSGKTTVARVLAAILGKAHGLAVAELSLDDLYLSLADRTKLAEDVHPLFRTRGVPGTHDVGLGAGVIRRLISARPDDVTRIPRFDKSRDDPYPAESWPEFRGRADVVIFEGWCMGAKAQGEIELWDPINELEREFDADGKWRGYANEQLAGPYRVLFGLLNRLVLLRAPSFEVVFEWRRQQEQKLAAKVSVASLKDTRIMGDEELKRFIAHYERITRHILEEMPSRADIVVQLNEQRQMVKVSTALARGA